MKRLPLLSLVFAALLFAGAGCFTTTVNVNTNTASSTNAMVEQNVSATVTIDRGDASPVRTFTTIVPTGSTALTVLAQAASDNNLTLDLKDTSFGKYVQGIDGRAAEGNMYWQFRVNEKEAAVGVDAYVVQDGDTIGFVYTK